MRKLLLISAFLFIAAVGYCANVVDSYSEAYYTTPLVHYGLANPYEGQTFWVSTPCTLDSAKFYLSYLNSPSGDTYVQIYAHTGTWGSTGIPAGSPLATSDVRNATVVTTLALYTYTFSGANRISLSTGPYVAIHYFGGTVSLNWLKYGIDNTTKTHAGNWVVSADTTNWSGSASYDSIFYIYGVAASTATTTTSNFFNFFK